MPTPTELAALVPADATDVWIIYWDELESLAGGPLAPVTQRFWAYSDAVYGMVVDDVRDHVLGGREPAWTLMASRDNGFMAAYPSGSFTDEFEDGNGCRRTADGQHDVVRCYEWEEHAEGGWSLSDTFPGAASALERVDVLFGWSLGDEWTTAGAWPLFEGLPIQAVSAMIASDGSMRADVLSAEPDRWVARMGGLRAAAQAGADAVLAQLGVEDDEAAALMRTFVDAAWQPIAVSRAGDTVTISSGYVVCASVARSPVFSVMLVHGVFVDPEVDITVYDTPWTPPTDVLASDCAYTARPVALPWDVVEQLSFGPDDMFLMWSMEPVLRYIIRNEMGLLTQHIRGEVLDQHIRALARFAADDGSVAGIVRVSMADLDNPPDLSETDLDNLDDGVLPRAMATTIAPAAQLECIEPGYCTTSADLFREQGAEPDPRIAIARDLVPDFAALAAVFLLSEPGTVGPLPGIGNEALEAVDVYAVWLTASGDAGVAFHLRPGNEEAAHTLRDNAQALFDAFVASMISANRYDHRREDLGALSEVRVTMPTAEIVYLEVDLPTWLAPEIWPWILPTLASRLR